MSCADIQLALQSSGNAHFMPAFIKMSILDWRTVIEVTGTIELRNVKGSLNSNRKEEIPLNVPL